MKRLLLFEDKSAPPLARRQRCSGTNQNPGVAPDDPMWSVSQPHGFGLMQEADPFVQEMRKLQSRGETSCIYCDYLRQSRLAAPTRWRRLNERL
jgi:hypothetical protein